jgi:hypothetical protein
MIWEGYSMSKQDFNGFLDDWFTDKENNADFYSSENQQFFVKVLTKYNYKQKKPIIFIPCASTKPISKSRTHCYLSAITRNDLFEKIILSEPQTIIPYSMEDQCPNYNYPPKNLTRADRWQLVRRLNIFLNNLHEADPNRVRLYYIGSLHHFSVLQNANKICKFFYLIYTIPALGIRDYSKYAEELANEIIKLEELKLCSNH